MPTPSVEIINWPEQADRRAAIRRDGHLCLLIVAAGAAPPLDCEATEDWLREPVDPRELELRSETLERRFAVAHSTPLLSLSTVASGASGSSQLRYTPFTSDEQS